MLYEVITMHEAYKAGQISLDEFLSAEAGMSRSAGTCSYNFV